MTIGEVSLFNADATNVFFDDDAMTELNGKEVKILSNEKQANVELTHYFTRMKDCFQNRSAVRPMMSKPEHIDGTITGGYDEDRGAYVEGKITFTWDNDPDKKDTNGKNGDRDYSKHYLNSR